MITARMKRSKKVELKLPVGPSRVHVGFPAGKVSSDIVNRAVWNHYGTRGGGWGGPIPPRPFLLNAMRSNKDKYRDALKASAAKILTGEVTFEATLNKLGILAQGDVQQEITDLRDPPNSEVTIARKGSSNPLIDTGQMRQSVTWEIKE